MMSQDKLITLLKINGVDKSAPDADIKAVLADAHYTKDEIDSALFVLKQKKEETNEIRTDGLQKVFYTDNHLMPSEVSNLLGIDFDASHVFKPKKILTRTLTTGQMVSIILVATLIGVVAVMYYMFANGIGLFHPTAIAFTL